MIHVTGAHGGASGVVCVTDNTVLRRSGLEEVRAEVAGSLIGTHELMENGGLREW